MKEILLIIANKEKADIYLTKQYSSEILKLETINYTNIKKTKKDFGSHRIVKENKGPVLSFKVYILKISQKIKRYLQEHKSLKVVLVAESGFLGTLKKYLLSQRISLFFSLSEELNSKNEKDLLENIKKDLLFLS